MWHICETWNIQILSLEASSHASVHFFNTVIVGRIYATFLSNTSECYGLLATHLYGVIPRTDFLVLGARSGRTGKN